MLLAFLLPHYMVLVSLLSFFSSTLRPINIGEPQSSILLSRLSSNLVLSLVISQSPVDLNIIHMTNHSQIHITAQTSHLNACSYIKVHISHPLTIRWCHMTRFSQWVVGESEWCHFWADILRAKINSLVLLFPCFMILEARCL